MLEPITKQELIDASADALALEQVVNGTDTSDVTSRLARTYPTLAKALRLIVENGLLGATPFNLGSQMIASSLVDGDYAVVTDDPNPEINGFYQRQSGLWEYLAWNPLNQAKAYADANPMFRPSVLAAAADFNTLIVEGRTVVPTNEIAEACTNRPSATAGVLDVALIGSGVLQVYRVFEFDLAYERQRLSGGTWTDWVQSASKDMVDTSAANTLQGAKDYADANPLFKPLVLSAGIDFNAAIIGGRTVVPTNAIAATCTNAPSTQAGVLDVALINATALMQTYRTYATYQTFARQKLNDGSWSVWVEGSTRAYADTQAAAALASAKAYADASAMFKPVLLGSDDLDSKTAPGIYLQNNYSGFDLSAKHYPVLENGYLEVVKTDASSYVIQRYFAVTSNKVYMRSFAGAWSAWALSYDYVTYINAQPLVKYTATSLDNVTNLDGLITPGIYFQANSTYATVGLNYPTAVAGMLNVFATGIFVYQEYRAYTTNVIYRRVRYNGTWQSWVFNDGTVTIADGSLTQAKLSTTLQRAFSTRLEWFAVGTTPNVNYDPTTRVLSWSHSLLAQSNRATSSNRVIVPAGSITIPNTAYSVVYLDLTMVDAMGNVTIDAIKSSAYSGGAYRENLDTVPIAKIDPTSTGLARSCAGFLPITNTGSSASTVKNPQRCWVEKTATQCSIYVKGSAGNNWICYLLTHVVVPNDGTSPDSNLDLWRMTAATEVTSTFAAVKQIVGSGEWECAINITGETDHVGGYHGDEILSLAYFVANGVRYAADATFSGECDQFDFVQKSTIYRKNSATVFAQHTQYHRFTKDGLRLQQELDFAITIGLATAWIGMFPIRRTLGDDVANPGAQVTDRASRYPLYTDEDVSTAGFAINRQPMRAGKNLIIYGQSTGISGEVVWSDFVGLPSTFTYINGGAIYNKVYFSAIANGADYTVTAGEHWELTTRYRVNTTA